MVATVFDKIALTARMDETTSMGDFLGAKWAMKVEWLKVGKDKR